MRDVAKKVKDKKILRLIRSYLKAGVMEDGLVKATGEGSPQGGPLSPLLSNIMLDNLDKELERRKLRFARYADDCNIYVKSEKAGKRVMESVTKYLVKELKLKVNQEKSDVDDPKNRQFLGFTFMKGKQNPYILTVDKSRIQRFKSKIRASSKSMRGSEISVFIKKKIVPITRGWSNYFGIAETKALFKDLDGWIRRKIRSAIWRQWKKPRTRYQRLQALGVKEKAARGAYASKGPWRMARTQPMHKALSNQVIEKMGYVTMESIAVRL
jgi:RNA-directed DNA polymerase